MVHWLGWSWDANGTSHLYYASDYFDFMYRAGEYLIEAGLAYVDEQTRRADARQPRRLQHARHRQPVPQPHAEPTTCGCFARCATASMPTARWCCAPSIDMASPNINLRDPTLYRIKRATHHNTGDRWCIYPMYTYAHPIEDALENITHSFCTLEFEDQRPFYDWLLDKLAEGGLLQRPLPKQIEFGRLNLTYVITSKRKLKQLVDEGHVSGWDDPRMPTLAGMRRRGYTPASIRKMAEDTGASQDQHLGRLLGARDRAARRPRAAGAARDGGARPAASSSSPTGPRCSARRRTASRARRRAHPQRPELGQRHFTLGPEVWIERDDFAEVPPKGFFRLFPGNKVRLKYGMVVECTGCEKDASGPRHRGAGARGARHQERHAGRRRGEGQGHDHLGRCARAGEGGGSVATVRLFDRLFTEPQPDAGERDFLQALNPNSLALAQAWVEPSLAGSAPDQRFQFERHGYFVTDRIDHSSATPVFNRITGLKDSWSK